jgi:alpha-glucoside transport system permease protein
MNPFRFLNRIFRSLPVNLALIFMCLIWIIPTLGLFVSSFRDKESVRTTGWWTVLAPRAVVGQADYTTYCASCHGPKGNALAGIDLSDPAVVSQYTRDYQLLAMLKQPVNGEAHLKNPVLPENANDSLAILGNVLKYMQSLSTKANRGLGLTLSNYADALVGYKGTNTYLGDCAAGGAAASIKFKCNSSDLLNPEGMGAALVNSILVTVPATLLVIAIAAFAAYAFAWMDFRGRQWMFALLVGLQIVPLQMTLVPISRLYASIGLQSTFLGIWLFHTGFGLPYAIYLLRNFIGSLPREIFESAYLDGANHWTAFRQLALPLAMPAIASLGIFQFLWVWNDFLVAKIFLSSHPVLTVQITNLIDPRGSNWHILTGAAFLSFLIPMFVFFAFQKYFVRGMLAGSVKG